LEPGTHRDRIAKVEEVIAFDMEELGLGKKCLLSSSKEVCDYADSHKNKKWQNFAAATSASACKAILERYILTEKAAKQTSSVANAV
jgi:nucleoside phosphorylase